jgi:hypothetical protein
MLGEQLRVGDFPGLECLGKKPMVVARVGRPEPGDDRLADPVVVRLQLDPAIRLACPQEMFGSKE